MCGGEVVNELDKAADSAARGTKITVFALGLSKKVLIYPSEIPL